LENKILNAIEIPRISMGYGMTYYEYFKLFTKQNSKYSIDSVIKRNGEYLKILKEKYQFEPKLTIDFMSIFNTENYERTIGTFFHNNYFLRTFNEGFHSFNYKQL
jgi:hypothetical protein